MKLLDLEILYEKYKFDYIYINPKNIEDLCFDFSIEEIFDFKGPKDYLGKTKIKDISVEVYFDKKITPGDVIFKYKNIKKERNIKLNNMNNSD